MQIVIRRAEVQDASELVVLCKAMEYEASEQEVQERLGSILSRPDHRFFVAIADGKVVGFCHCYVRLLVEVPLAIEIGGLAVSEAHQGAGIGRQLVSAVEAWAKEVGFESVVLSSNIKRTAAHEFYKHIGYVTEKQQFAFYKQIT